MNWRWAVVAALVAGLAACGPEEAVEGGAAGSGGAAGGGGAGGSGGTAEPEPSCGDGVREGSEQCDDGEKNSDEVPDACREDCSLPTCGDGVVDKDEDCEGSEPLDCAGFGDFTRGTLACSKTCTWDTSDCGVEPVCGDGVREGDEECDDGEDNSDEVPDACRGDCSLPICGDGVVDKDEDCDGAETLDCAGFGDFTRGTLACSSTCGWDTSGCGFEPVCGNGVREGSEQCDEGEDNSNDTPGACRKNCTLPRCGDGVIDGDELCDGRALGGTTCADLDFDRGTLACRACTAWDTSQCVKDPFCGDGIINGSEQCDGTAIPSCGSLGFASGTVTCNQGCTADTSACVPFPSCRRLEDQSPDCSDPLCADEPACNPCGNGRLDPGEQCDDGNRVAHDGCSATCTWEGGDCSSYVNLNLLQQGSEERWQWSSDTGRFEPTWVAGCREFTSGQKDGVASFTAPRTGTWLIDVSASFDAMLYVWNGVCAQTSNTLACTDEPEYTVLDLAQGQTVYIVVDGYMVGSNQTEFGPFTLSIEPFLPTVEVEPNDTFATATPLPAGDMGRGVAEPGDVDLWYFDAPSMTVNIVFTGSDALRNCGNGDHEDTRLRILDDSETVLFDNDDNIGRCSFGLVVNFDAEPKRFYLEVTRGPNGAQVPVPYFLHVQQNQQ